MSKSSKEINAELRKASISAGTDSPPPDPKAKAKEIEKARKKSTMIPVMISGASPSVSAGSGQTKPLPSIAGVQFDAYEKSFTAKSLSKDPHQILVTWPQDDIVVEDQKRKMRTAKPYLPVRAQNGIRVFVLCESIYFSANSIHTFFHEYSRMKPCSP